MLIIQIIKSLLDLDRYKLTMSQFIYCFYRGKQVTFRFKNRSKDKKINAIMVALIPQIKKEIAKVQNMKLTFFEMLYLKTQLIFKDDYINALSTMQLPDVHVGEKDGVLDIHTTGDWYIVTLWETIILSIVAELYARVIAGDKYFNIDANRDLSIEELLKVSLIQQALEGKEDAVYELVHKYESNAMKLLEGKIESYLRHPSIAFFEFGSRRRFSASLQEKVVVRLNDAFHKPQFMGSSQFLGTSNEYLAMKLGIKAGGTMAHEMFMVIAALNNQTDQGIIDSQYEFLRQWSQFYGYDLSVALTDTFGSDFFFAHCPQDIAQMYLFREDSAIDVFKYTDNVVDMYKRHKVNLNEKLLIHSNGLTAPKVVEIDNYSHGKLRKVYGQGTDLTCDVGFDFPHVSIVMKAVMVDGKPTVKISDNLAKAISDSEDEKQRYIRIFEYKNKESQIQVY